MIDHTKKTNKVLSGKHKGTLGYVKRFSMCNCITVYFPDTYTAHAMTVDFFIKIVRAGIRVETEHINLWPSGYVKVFKVPKKIDTFMFSAFNEAYHPNYTFSKGIRYTIGPHEGANKLRNLGTKIPRIPIKAFGRQLRALSKKVDQIWDSPLKVLVEYDKTRATSIVQARMEKYEKCAREVLGWPVVSVRETGAHKDVWCHYSRVAQEDAYAQLLDVEADTQ